MKNLKLSLMLFVIVIYNNMHSQCSFTGLNSNYLTTDINATLVPTPSGGTFSGPGVTGATFDPSTAGVGAHTISYITPATYSVSTISYIGTSGTASTNISLLDNAISGTVPLGFNFDYWESTYSSLKISSNGFLTFDNIVNTPANSAPTPQTIPDLAGPNNLIASYWTDLDPGNGLQGAGQNLIYYTTLGSAPNRLFKTNYHRVDQNPDGFNVQIETQLYETSNIIEIHITTAPSDASNVTMGLENAGGTQAVIVPARNNTTFGSQVNNSWRFTPIASCTTTVSVTVGQNIAWNGSINSDWTNVLNWSSAVVPTLTDVIIIPDVSGASGNFPTITPSITLGGITVDAGASLTVATGMVLDGTFTNNGTVTLQDGAYLDDFTNVGSSFVGNIIVETIAANGISNDQRFISSPVNNAAFSEIADDLNGPWGAGAQGADGVAVTVDNCATPSLMSSSNYGNLFEINEALVVSCPMDAWVVRSAGNLENGRGYSAYLPNGSTFEMEGTPNSGVISIATTNSGSGILNGEGWNLIGNPYPSPISRDALVAAGGTNASYFVTSGVYQGSYTAYGIGSNIAVSQGVQVFTPTTGAINFSNAMRNTNASIWYSTSEWFTHKLEIAVLGTQFADKTTLFFNEEASNSYEPMFDVVKRKSSAGHPTLSTKSAGENLTLNGLSVNDLGQTVPMILEPGANGNFKLNFEGIETFPVNTTIYIKDLLTNSLHNIADGDYSFTASTSDNANRFEIIFVPEVQFLATNEDCDGNMGSLVLNNLNFTANRTFELISNNNVLTGNDLENLNETLNAGDYTLNVTDQFGGVQVYDIAIDSDESIEAAFTVSATNVSVDEVITLNSSTLNANELDWNFGNGSTLSGIANPTYSFDLPGVYDVSLNVSTEDCQDSKTTKITVSNKTTGIELIDGEEIVFYPNPTKGMLYVKYSEAVQLELVNVLGRTILKSNKKEINLRSLSKGIYNIKVYNESKVLISTTQIIKE